MRHLKKLQPALLAFVILAFAGCSKESRIQRHQDRADAYFAAKEYPQAEVEYLNAFRLNPTNGQVIARLGIIYSEQGRLARAYAFIMRARELVPNDVDVRLKAGTLFLADGKLPEARAEAEFVMTAQPTNQIAPIMLAESARSQEDVTAARTRLQALQRDTGDTVAVNLGFGSLFIRERKFSEAEAAFKRALEMDPKCFSAYHALGAVYLAQNDLTNAGPALKMAAELSPLRSNLRLHYADHLLRTGDLEGAKRVLAETTKAAPDFLPAWMALGEIALGQRQLDECRAIIAQVQQRDGEHPEALLLGARVKLAGGEIDKAIGDLDLLLRMFPRSAPAHYHLALARLAKDDPNEAFRHASEAVVLNPNYDEAVLLQAQLNIRRNNVGGAIASLRQLIERRPRLMQAHLLLVGAYRAGGEPTQALAASRRMEEIFPRNPQIMLLTAALLRELGRAAESREAFEKLLVVSPGYIPAVEQLIDLDLADKRYSTAMDRVQERLAASPDLPEVHFLLAKVHFAQTNIDAGEQALLKAIELKPDYRPAYMLLARAYVTAHKHPQAIQRLEQVLAKNPNDTAAQLQLAMIHSETKNFAAARDAYEKLLTIAPRSSIALNNLAYIYSEHIVQLDKAYEMARQARQVTPNDPFSADTLGWILYKRGEYPWALALLQESVERLSGEPEVQFHLGMTHYMMGQERPALAALQLSLNSERDFVGKDEAARRLAILKTDPANATQPVIASLEKTLADHPNDPIALFRLAGIYERNGNVSGAVNLYERALQQNPRNVPAMDRLARLHVERLQDRPKALQLARNARNLAPDDPQIAHLLGKLAFDSGEFTWALGLLQESDRRVPRQAEVLHDLAWAYAGVGRIPEARETMQSALVIDPNSPRAQSARRFVEAASLYAEAHTSSAAADQIRLMLKEEPGYLPALAALGIIQQRASEIIPARQTFEDILVRYPTFAPAHRHLAELYLSPPADPQKAYAHAVKARELFPRDADVARALGILSYQRGEHARAAALLRESASERAQDGELFAYLGMAQYQLRQRTEARETLQKALALNPNQALANDLKRLLTELQ